MTGPGSPVTGPADDPAAVARERLGALVAELPGSPSRWSGRTWSVAAGRRRIAWLLVDHHGDGRVALCVRADPRRQEELLARGGAWFRPSYLGARGWVAADLDPDAGDGAEADWEALADLLAGAWRSVASARQLAAGPVATAEPPPPGD